MTCSRSAVAVGYRLVVLWALLILYGSFFPFDFRLHRFPDQPLTALIESWPAQLNRFVVRDLGVNLTLYMPLGAFWWFARDRKRPARALAPIVGGLLLSCVVELLQYFTDTRTASVIDVACNTAGTTVGVLIARLTNRHLPDLEQRVVDSAIFRPSANLALLGCWVGYQMAPLFPTLSRTKLAAKLAVLESTSSLSLVATFVAWTEWLAVAWLLIGVARRQLPWLVGLLLLVPARLLLEGRSFSIEELLGGALAVAAWQLGLGRVSGQTRIVTGVLLASILLSGLRPFHLAETPSAFSWVPFSGALMAEREFAMPELFRKAFVYGASIWLLQACGIALVTSAIVVAAALGALEAAQVYLPGRTAEITDPLVGLGVAYALSLAARARARAASRPG